MKKILALSLAAVMALSFVGCSKDGEDATEQNEGKKAQVIENTITYENATFGYEVNEDGRYDITSVEYDGKEMIDIKIPSEIDGMLVTGIASEAFKADTFIRSVEIPSTVTKIGDWAFYSCVSIEEINLPSSVVEIGKGAFWNCVSLSKVTLPSTLSIIGDYAFMDCMSLVDIVIPGSVKTIGEGAFFGCSTLEQITIPYSVNKIGRGAFLYCSSLELVTIENAQLTFPTDEDGKAEGVFVACSSGLKIKAAADSTAKQYVELMNEGVTDENKIAFEVLSAQ